LQDAVLAVHSYAGMIGTAIADRMPQRLKHLVYVDAVVPKPGESWSSTHASATREARIAAAQASPDFSFPPPDPSVFGLAAEDHDWVQRRQTPHPGHTYQAPLQFDPRRVAGVARTFVDCVKPGWAPSTRSARAFAMRTSGTAPGPAAAASRWWNWPPGTTPWSARRKNSPGCCSPAPDAARDLHQARTFPFGENPSWVPDVPGARQGKQ
jgi:pimeloyl-ACP methyl ester carboxylesterase